MTLIKTFLLAELHNSVANKGWLATIFIKTIKVLHLKAVFSKKNNNPRAINYVFSRKKRGYRR